MRSVRMILAFVGLQLFAGWVCAETLTVNSLRYWTQPTKARLVLDTSWMPGQNVKLLQNPARLIISLKKANFINGLSQPAPENAFFAKFYTTSNSKEFLTFIIELKKNVTFKSLALKPNEKYGHRLVVDVFDADAAMLASQTPVKQNPIKEPIIKASLTDRNRPLGVKAKADPQLIAAVANKPVRVSRKSSTRKSIARHKDIIIAIDAGHGGKDPGSHGAAGTQEKRVVFEIAKKLERMIAAQPGMRPVMVRKGDQFIKLRQRMKIARAAKADLFVSIHADAFKNSDVKGASVFTLSNRGATSEAARWLANNENAADLVGGVSLDNKDDMLASVLLDLSQTATTEASGNVAKKILANFKSINPLHKADVQKAGFMVLKSPDIPSILVETAFISNPEEEMKLRSSAHQTKVARAIFNGIVGYFRQHAPIADPDTRMAEASQNDNV